MYSDCVTKPFCTQGLTQIQTDDDGPCWAHFICIIITVIQSPQAPSAIKYSNKFIGVYLFIVSKHSLSCSQLCFDKLTVVHWLGLHDLMSWVMKSKFKKNYQTCVLYWLAVVMFTFKKLYKRQIHN